MSFSTVWKTFRGFFHSMENFFAVFPQYGKLFRVFSTVWKTFSRFFHSMENFFAFFPQYGKRTARAGFSLVELLVVMAATGLLTALAAGGWSAARAAAQSAACRSNLRQLATANLAHAVDHGRYVAAAADIEGANSIRWHGVRAGGGAFDGSLGPLAPYLGGGGSSAWVRRCPGFRPEAAGFEAACGGYGYNAHGVGSEVCLPHGNGTTVGMRPASITRPAHTVMFADAAFLQGSGARARLIEYSFAEPPKFASGGTPWPSIHFRHRGRANVAWCDGRVTSEPLDRTDGRSAAHALGWFGPDDNRLFDPF